MEGMEARGGFFLFFFIFLFLHHPTPRQAPGGGEGGKGAEIMFIFQHNLLAVSICFYLHIQEGGGIF